MCFTAFSCVLICWSDALCLVFVLPAFDFFLPPAAGPRVFFAAEAFFLPALLLLLLPATKQGPRQVIQGPRQVILPIKHWRKHKSEKMNDTLYGGKRTLI